MRAWAAAFLCEVPRGTPSGHRARPVPSVGTTSAARHHPPRVVAPTAWGHASRSTTGHGRSATLGRMSLRRASIDRISGGLFDVLVVGAGINGAVSAASLAGRGASVALIDRGDFGGFTSQESSNLVWGGFKYLEHYELPLVFGLCRSRNRLMKAYPDNVKEIGFLADARPSRRRTVRGSPALGATAYWAIGLFGTRAARTCSTPSEVEGRGAGHRHDDRRAAGSSTRTPTSSTTTRASCSRSSARRSRPAPRPPTTSSCVSAERVGDRWVCRLRDTDTGEEFTTSARVDRQRRRPVRRRAQRAVGPRRPSTGSSTRRASTSSSRASRRTRHDRVLAFFDDTRRLFYVIPMGRRSVIGTTDTRVDTPFTHVDRRGPRVPARPDQRPPRPAAAADPRRRHRRAVRRAAARRARASGGDHDRHRLDVARAASTRSSATTTAASSPSSAASSPTASTSARRSPTRSRRSASRSRRTCTTGTASRPRRPATEFYRQARLMKLDALRTKPDTEPLSDRLWRRYGRRAFDLLEAIRADPTMGEDVMDSADYLRAELHTAAEHEMIVTLDDFMRRRSQDRPRRAATATSWARPGCARSPRSCSAPMPTAASPSTSPRRPRPRRSTTPDSDRTAEPEGTPSRRGHGGSHGDDDSSPLRSAS